MQVKLTKISYIWNLYVFKFWFIPDSALNLSFRPCIGPSTMEIDFLCWSLTLLLPQQHSCKAWFQLVEHLWRKQRNRRRTQN